MRPQKRNNDLFLFCLLDSVVVITFSCVIIFCDYFSVVNTVTKELYDPRGLQKVDVVELSKYAGIESNGNYYVPTILKGCESIKYPLN